MNQIDFAFLCMVLSLIFLFLIPVKYKDCDFNEQYITELNGWLTKLKGNRTRLNTEYSEYKINESEYKSSLEEINKDTIVAINRLVNAQLLVADCYYNN